MPPELDNEIGTWLIIGVAALAGYFVVSKLFDFFHKNSVLDAKPEDEEEK